jgi:type II secretory pathway pseudopilin PulG
MIKILRNQDGFTGLIGLIVAIVVIGVMSAMIVPTFTARMNYKQAKYAVGVIRTIENAENAYMAKNNSFADLTTLASQGYLSSNFLQSVQGAMYPQPNWINLEIANQAGSACIDNGSGCPNNPGVGATGFFIGIYGIPPQFQTYIEHEIPGSGAAGTQDISYVAPIPSSPPVLNAQNANYANSAGSANYANTAGYANSSGLPAWSQEANALVGTGIHYWGPDTVNNTGNTILVSYDECSSGIGVALVRPGGYMPASTYYVNAGRGFCYGSYDYILSAYSG